uniref:Uncharacterized protein n=1 Tax=Ditylenchus dipsaci TaxID=166011 RepID=A0A915DMQ9_9BILA
MIYFLRCNYRCLTPVSDHKFKRKKWTQPKDRVQPRCDVFEVKRELKKPAGAKYTNMYYQIFREQNEDKLSSFLTLQPTTTQPLLQPTPPLFLKRPDATTPSECAQQLRLPSKQSLLPITSIPAATTPLIYISDAQPSREHPYSSKIQLSQPAPIETSGELQTHLLHSGIVRPDMLPASITRRASVQPTMSTLSHLHPSQPPYMMIEVDQSQLPLQIQAQLARPSTSSQETSQEVRLAYVPQLDLYIYPSNPSIQLKMSSSECYSREHGGIDQWRNPFSPYPEGAQLRGQVIKTPTAIQFLPNSELKEPTGEVATKILGEINQLLTSGLPMPIRRRQG